MKILYICTFYHRALLFRQQMDALNELGHDIYAFNTAQYGDGIADKFIPIMDSRVKHFECWNKFDRIFFFPRQWKIEKKLEKEYSISEFDLIHSHLLLSSGSTALKMKKKYKIPYVVSVRVTDLKGFIKIPGFRYLANKIITESNGVIFLSNVHKRELLNKYIYKKNIENVENKSKVIGNCIEKYWEQNINITPKHIDNESPLKILSVAKIRPKKNLTVAAKTVSILNEMGIKATLTIVGENQDNEEMKKLKQYKNVELLPFANKTELLRLYRSHDVFLLPSLEETFGRVYVEAMTQGLPVIYTKNQGFDGNFEDGVVGYAIDSQNPQEIANRVIDIVNNYDVIQQNCVRLCSNFFEGEIINKLDIFYKESLKRG